MPGRSRPRLAVAACALLTVALAAAFAADNPPLPPSEDAGPAAPPPVQGQPPRTITRVYDVNDLLFRAVDFKNAPDFGFDPTQSARTRAAMETAASGGGMFGGSGPPADKVRDDPMYDLMKLLTNSVAPDTWRETGGPGGLGGPTGPGATIWPHGGTLVITQTAENHRKIRELLDAEREQLPRPVRIRAHWVLMQRRDLEGLLKPPAGGDGRPGRGATLEVDPHALEKLGGGAAHYRGETVCLSGQQVYFISVQSTAFAWGDPLNPDSTWTWDYLKTGLLLDVRNVISRDRGTAFLTLRSQVVNTDSPATRVATRPTSRPATQPAAPQRSSPDAAQYELNTCARIPVGPMVLIGGMTLDAIRGGPDAPQLYLFLQVTAD